MSLSDLLAQHDSNLNSEVSAFELELERLLHRAQSTVMARLLTQLTLDAGRIANTAGNRALLRKTDVFLQSELDTLGLDKLTRVFVGRFNGQVGWFKKVLDQTLGEVSAAKVLNFTRTDQRNLAILQQSAAQQIEETVTAAAQRARYAALLSVGGASPSDLTNTISDALGRSVGQAKGDAATAISTFYRTVADLGYQNIEGDGTVLRFKYVGPPAADPVIRPFCKRLMTEAAAGTTWTRAEIASMDNGQMPNVFISGGGHNCRHQFITTTAAIGAGA